MLEVDGVDRDVTTCPIGEAVVGVTLVNGLVTTFDEGTAVVRRAYTQAIAFELQSGDLLALDKGAWFGEMISIAMGTTLGDLVYDDSANWKTTPRSRRSTSHGRGTSSGSRPSVIAMVRVQLQLLLTSRWPFRSTTAEGERPPN